MLKISETFNRTAGDVPRKEQRARRPMNLLKAVCALLAFMTSSYSAVPASAAETGKVLVILSSAKQLELPDGKRYHTGYYLDELAVHCARSSMPATRRYSPIRKATRCLSTRPPTAKYSSAAMTPCGRRRWHSLKEFRARSIPRGSVILKEGTADYVGVFIPGGHAPMQDLVQEKTLGDILVTFHANARPTGLRCHGPTELLSTVSDPEAFWEGHGRR
jgi:hypothetical protein